MSILSTKAESHAAVLANGIAVSQKSKVKSMLAVTGPLYRDAIALWLDMKPSSVCARLNELVKSGEVVVVSQTIHPNTKRRVDVYGVKNVES